MAVKRYPSACRIPARTLSGYAPSRRPVFDLAAVCCGQVQRGNSGAVTLRYPYPANSHAVYAVSGTLARVSYGPSVPEGAVRGAVRPGTTTFGERGTDPESIDQRHKVQSQGETTH